ncbi:hypothetical protein [Dyella tabacisoli]|uniref:hypothetical protein n=1 Tax=Dyella tabacisoli TaxID=2282381 RepID=UPI0013B4186E|nr:hypothetical protein [Dyella tabacisoli]
MKQLDVVMHDSKMDLINPFGIQMDGPLQSQSIVEKRAPKASEPGDIAGIGSRGGDWG